MATLAVSGTTPTAAVTQNGPVTIYPSDDFDWGSGNGSIVIETADTADEAKYRVQKVFRQTRGNGILLNMTGDYVWRVRGNQADLSGNVIYH